MYCKTLRSFSFLIHIQNIALHFLQKHLSTPQCKFQMGSHVNIIQIYHSAFLLPGLPALSWKLTKNSAFYPRYWVQAGVGAKDQISKSLILILCKYGLTPLLWICSMVCMDLLH